MFSWLLQPTRLGRKHKRIKKCWSSVTVVSQVDQEDTDLPASHDSSTELTLPQPSFRKELQDLNDKWSLRMARLEALITKDQRSTPQQQPSFSPVKAPVPHIPTAGALSQTPFLQSSVPSGQAGPAFGPDRTQTSTSEEMTSPLESLYPEAGPEPVFAEPGPVPTVETSSSLLQFPARDVLLLDQIEEGWCLNRYRMTNRTRIPQIKTEL